MCHLACVNMCTRQACLASTRLCVALAMYAGCLEHIHEHVLLVCSIPPPEHNGQLISATTNTIACIHSQSNNKGHHAAAERVGTSILPHIQQHDAPGLGKESSYALGVMMMLATANKWLGRTDEAIALNVETMKIQKRVFGEDNVDTLTTSMNLANLYRQTGKIKAAIALYGSVLAKQQKTLGETHFRTLMTASNLEFTSAMVGSPGAEQNLAEILALQQKILSPGHQHLLCTQQFLDMARQFTS